MGTNRRFPSAPNGSTLSSSRSAVVTVMLSPGTARASAASCSSGILNYRHDHRPVGAARAAPGCVRCHPTGSWSRSTAAQDGAEHHPEAGTVPVSVRQGVAVGTDPDAVPQASKRAGVYRVGAKAAWASSRGGASTWERLLYPRGLTWSAADDMIFLPQRFCHRRPDLAAG